MLDWLFYRQNSTKTKTASNNAIIAELVGSIVHGLKFISRLISENIFYVELRQKECTNIKSIFFK